MIKKSKNLSSFTYDINSENIFTTLAVNCRNLTELDLQMHNNYDVVDVDSRLSEIFKNNKNLKSIKLDDINAHTEITGECFLSLDKNVVEEIALSGVGNIERDFLIQSLPNFTKLHTLELNDLDDPVFVYLAECISLCSKLKRLEIFGQQIHKDLNLFASSKNIEWLSITLNDEPRITKNFLDYMTSELLELKYLDMSADSMQSTSIKLTFNSMLNLPKKLEVLNISGHSNINGSGIENLPNLEELYCSKCEKLAEKNLISLLKCARNLWILDIRDCKKITNRVIETAIEETKKRTNNIVLEIQIEGTSIIPDGIKEESPFLRLA